LGAGRPPSAGALSVARIIERAGISRPTFHRYFGNAEQPLHALLTASNAGLVGGIRSVLVALGGRADVERALAIPGIFDGP